MGRTISFLSYPERSYILTCSRYIELNPVRENKVTHHRNYPWSSYRFNADGVKRNLISPNEMFLRLGRTELSRQQAYRELFKSHIDPDLLNVIRSSTNGNFVLGSDEFKDEISSMLKRRVVPGINRRPLKSG